MLNSMLQDSFIKQKCPKPRAARPATQTHETKASSLNRDQKGKSAMPICTVEGRMAISFVKPYTSFDVPMGT